MTEHWKLNQERLDVIETWEKAGDKRLMGIGKYTITTRTIGYASMLKSEYDCLVAEDPDAPVVFVNPEEVCRASNRIAENKKSGLWTSRGDGLLTVRGNLCMCKDCEERKDDVEEGSLGDRCKFKDERMGLYGRFLPQVNMKGDVVANVSVRYKSGTGKGGKKEFDFKHFGAVEDGSVYGSAVLREGRLVVYVKEGGEDVLLGYVEKAVGGGFVVREFERDPAGDYSRRETTVATGDVEVLFASESVNRTTNLPTQMGFLKGSQTIVERRLQETRVAAAQEGASGGAEEGGNAMDVVGQESGVEE